MSTPDPPAEKEDSFQAVNCVCECGFRLTSLSRSDVMLDAMSEGVHAYIVKDQTSSSDLRRQLEQHIATAPISS